MLVRKVGNYTVRVVPKKFQTSISNYVRERLINSGMPSSAKIIIIENPNKPTAITYVATNWDYRDDITLDYFNVDGEAYLDDFDGLNLPIKVRNAADNMMKQILKNVS